MKPFCKYVVTGKPRHPEARCDTRREDCDAEGRGNDGFPVNPQESLSTECGIKSTGDCGVGTVLRDDPS